MQWIKNKQNTLTGYGMDRLTQEQWSQNVSRLSFLKWQLASFILRTVPEWENLFLRHSLSHSYFSQKFNLSSLFSSHFFPFILHNHWSNQKHKNLAKVDSQFWIHLRKFALNTSTTVEEARWASWSAWVGWCNTDWLHWESTKSLLSLHGSWHFAS